jgi:hypothetical protein
MKQFNPFSQAQKWFNVFHLDRLKRIFHWMPSASIVRPDSLKRAATRHWNRRVSIGKAHANTSRGSASMMMFPAAIPPPIRSNNPHLNMSETFKTGVAARYGEATGITVDIELELPKKRKSGLTGDSAPTE